MAASPPSHRDLLDEVAAGCALAALGLPAVLGYALIAKMPIVTGLYTFLAPLLVFALLGASRHLIVAADSATAVLLAAGLVPLAVTSSAHYIVLAETTAILVGICLLIVRLFHLTFIANFLSRTLLIGFLTGVGIQVALTQLPALLGTHIQSSSPFVVLYHLASLLPHLHLLDASLGLIALALVLIFRRISRRIPGAFVVVTLGIIAGYALRTRHLTYIGAVPRGLPHPTFATIPLADFPRLIELSLAIALVVVAQSAATARAFAQRTNETINTPRDIIGLAAANVAAGLTGSFPVNASPTRAAMIEEAGGRTRLVSFIAAAITLLVLLFATGPLQYLPLSVLAAVVLSIAIRLIDLAGLRHVRHLRRDEFIVAILAATAVVLLGVEYGILIAVAVAVINHLHRGYAPDNFLVLLDEDDQWYSAPISARTPIAPGLYVYRFQASLWYANIGRFIEEAHTLVGPDTRLLCFDFTSIASVDYSAGAELARFIDLLATKNIAVRFTHVDAPVRAQLELYCVVKPGSDLIVRSTREVLTQLLDPPT